VELSETCALDVADRAGITLEEVGVIMNLTRERVRQLEMRGLAKLRVIADDEAPSSRTTKTTRRGHRAGSGATRFLAVVWTRHDRGTRPDQRLRQDRAWSTSPAASRRWGSNLSTGGTASLLSSEGVKVRQVQDFTGAPEMLEVG